MWYAGAPQSLSSAATAWYITSFPDCFLLSTFRLLFAATFGQSISIHLELILLKLSTATRRIMHHFPGSLLTLSRVSQVLSSWIHCRPTFYDISQHRITQTMTLLIFDLTLWLLDCIVSNRDKFAPCNWHRSLDPVDAHLRDLATFSHSLYISRTLPLRFRDPFPVQEEDVWPPGVMSAQDPRHRLDGS